VALTVRLPLGNYRVNASSFVSPDGRVNYAGSASTFFYAGDVLTGATKPVEIRFERFIVEGYRRRRSRRFSRWGRDCDRQCDGIQRHARPLLPPTAE
jgi:hypothetical protein